MSHRRSVNLVLGLATIAVSLIAIFVWLPLDTISGVVESRRGKLTIGDAFAPSVAFALLCIAGIVVLVEDRHGAPSPQIRLSAHGFILLAVCVFAISLALMRWTGPAAVSLFGAGDDVSYRALRDTPPWKYLGFLTGGTFLITSFITMASRRFRALYILFAVLMAGLLVVIYDLPFEDLLLPPNGDL